MLMMFQGRQLSAKWKVWMLFEQKKIKSHQFVIHMDHNLLSAMAMANSINSMQIKCQLKKKKGTNFAECIHGRNAFTVCILGKLKLFRKLN